MSDKPKLPHITESRPDAERVRLLGLVTQDAAEYLGLCLDTDSPELIVATVNDCVRSIKKGERLAFPKDAEVEMLLGSLPLAMMISLVRPNPLSINSHPRSEYRPMKEISEKLEEAMALLSHSQSQKRTSAAKRLRKLADLVGGTWTRQE